MYKETILEKTAKSQAEWFAIIEKFGGKEKGHAITSKYLMQNYELSAWWAQTLVTEYEYVNGIRMQNERKLGFEFTVQRTVNLNVDKAYLAFTGRKHLIAWLSPYVQIELKVGGKFNFDDVAELSFIKIVPERLLKLDLITLQDGAKSRIDIDFINKSNQKTIIKITNSRLRSSKEVAINKSYWSSILDSFKKYQNNFIAKKTV